MSPPSLWHRAPRWMLAGLLLAGLGLRLYWALTQDGVSWPDEIYQSVEPAHRWVFGYGFVAWEFADGARNWLLPAFLALWMKLVSLGGSGSPALYWPAIQVILAGLTTGTAWGSYRLARALGASPIASLAGAAVFALGSVPLYFGARALSENAAALPVVWGLAWALPLTARRGEQWAGAVLLGLAAGLRLHCAIFCVGLLCVLAARREGRRFLETLGVLTLCALLLGVLDWVTWGRFFHSARVYLDFNLVQGKASGWGTEPFHFYGRVLFTAMPALSAATLFLSLVAALKRARGLFFLAASFVFLHALEPHKELRFLLPALPLFAALAGLGLDSLKEKVSPVAAGLGLVLLSGLSAAQAGRLRFQDLGQYENSRPQVSAWDDGGPVNRLLVIAGQQPDLCGLKTEAAHVAWTRGYSALHRQVPLYSHRGPPRQSGHFNYVITVPAAAQGAQRVAQDGHFVLVRLPVPGCIPDPHFSWRLP